MRADTPADARSMIPVPGVVRQVSKAVLPLSRSDDSGTLNATRSRP